MVQQGGHRGNIAARTTPELSPNLATLGQPDLPTPPPCKVRRRPGLRAGRCGKALATSIEPAAAPIVHSGRARWPSTVMLPNEVTPSGQRAPRRSLSPRRRSGCRSRHRH